MGTAAVADDCDRYTTACGVLSLGEMPFGSNHLIHETSSQLNVPVTKGLSKTNPAVLASSLKAS
jgi:hypothetical protein